MNIKFIVTGVICILVTKAVIAQENTARPDSHAPIGVMGDHTHKKGEFMISYRLSFMRMEDNLIGADDVSPDEIATTIPNRFSGMEGMPLTLRVVPLEMTMNMHMIGVMYAPTNKLTLMAMTMYMTNSMDHVTYQGGMGTEVLGNFKTESSGISDIRVSGLYQLTEHLHGGLGVSIPTGSIEEEDQVVTPMGMEPTLRLPYPMQIGSGTWDLIPGVTYFKRLEKIGWGAQLSSIIRLGENDNDFKYGNQLSLTAWGSYLLTNCLSGSLRANYLSVASIDGIDTGITAPVQTANPDFIGGSRLDLLAGLNIVGQSGFVRNQRIAIEFGLPVFQDLNGPQLATKSTWTLGWQYAF